ncbi:MAG: class I SAM-dependent methyltransferase [Mariniblastus sp.]|nr:class I SAM-dependent methyltransferase [Mariniblastus sp.]
MSTDTPVKPQVNEALVKKIQDLGPWHMNIQLTEDLNTGQVFSNEGEVYHRPSNAGVSLLNLRDGFLDLMKRLYPEGLGDKRFLDCACNAGGYCFWAREMNAKAAFGFDVREHWIQQARFVKNHRVVGPTDGIGFQVKDLYDLPKLEMNPFDITIFKGIFYHLPDPITGLKIAADMTNEVMLFNTSTTWGEKDGYMKSGWESRENVMSGVHGLKWYPTGPKVMGDILRWLGFKEMKLMFYKQQYDQPQLGRTEIIASKVEGKLDAIGGEWLT